MTPSHNTNVIFTLIWFFLIISIDIYYIQQTTNALILKCPNI